MALHRRCEVPVTSRASRVGLMVCLALLWLALPVAAGPPPYQLVFVPPTPLPPDVSETDVVMFGVQLQGACAGVFTPVVWEVDVQPGLIDPADPSDYGVPAPGFLMFEPGNLTQFFSIPIIDEGVTEGPETFDIQLTPGVSGADLDCTEPSQQPSQTQYGLTVTILGDGPTVVDVFVSDTVVTEGDVMDDFAIFNVTLSQPNPDEDPVSIQWTTSDGTATGGQDYSVASGTVSILPGETSQAIAVPVFDDSQVEDEETFFLDLINTSTNAQIVDGQGQATIQDNDFAQQFDVVIDDAAAPEDHGPITFDVHLMPANPGPEPITVDWATSDGTATGGEDYVNSGGQVTFMPGDAVQEVMVALIDDSLLEGNETFFVNLSNPPENVQITDAQAIGTIDEDDDAQQPPGLSIDDVMVLEGDAGLTVATFTVSLSRGASQNDTVIVSYATMDGTATEADNDYQPVAGQLTFEPEETSKTVMVNVVGDTRAEADEGFFVDLSAADGAVIVTGRGRGTIRNDDNDGLPSLSISDVAINEGDEGSTLAVFAATLSNASSSIVSVDVETADGTAIAGEDYQSASATLTFPPGRVTTSFNVTITGDTAVEADELFAVNLFNPVNATIADGIGRGLIRNDDGGESSSLRFVRDRQTVMEGAGRAEVFVERIGGLSSAVQATVATVAGTATAGQDFGALRTVVRWRPGEGGRKAVQVVIQDDNQQEGDETLGLRLSQPVGAELATPNQQLLAIIDDDTPLRLEAVGDQEFSARVREDFDVQVRASRMDGSPVAGATVVWRVQGRAELVGPEEQSSDEDGVSTARIRPQNMPGQATVIARLLGTESAVSFVVMIEGDLGNLGGGSGDDLDEGDMDIGGVLDEACVTATGDLLEACEYLFGIGDSTERQAALEGLTPRDVVSQGNAAVRAPRIQLRNIGGRLNALRGGNSRLAAVDQLSISIQGDAVAMGTLRSAVSGYGLDLEKLSRVLDDAIHGRSPTRLAAKNRDGGDAIDLESPWGFFINGRVSFGEAPQTGRETGYDFETQGVTAGIDYRVGDRLVIGAGLGYLGTNVDIARDGGDLDVSGYSVSLYGTYYTRKFYVDGIVAYGRNDYEMERIIELPRAFRGATRLVTRGEPEGDQLSFDLGVGYDFSIGAATLGGFLRGSLIDASVDAFGETGAGPFDLLFREQAIDSLQGEAGFELSYPASFPWGVVQPSLRLSYLHEFMDDRRVIRARFRSDALGRPFAIVTDTPDRDFLNVGAGVTVTLPRSMATYLLFDTDLERDDLDIYTVSGGFRLQF